MRKTLLFLLWFVGHWAISQSVVPNEVVKERLKTSAFKNIDVFSAENNSRNSVPSDIKEYSILNLKRESIKSLLSTYSENIELSIPSTDRSNLTLQLVEIRYDDMKVFDAGSKKQIKYKKGKHYRGQIKGNDKSLVALSFFENDVMGFISDERNNGNLVIGKMQDNSEQFIIYKDDEMMKKLELNCGTKSGISDYSREVLFHDHDHGSGERALTDCVRFFYEVDDDIVTEKGGATNATNYVTGLHNQVAALYAAESINVLISEIFVWTTTSPYNGTSSGAMLTQFEANKNGFNGNLAMLLSYEASGGIAYVNTLCSNISDYRMGFSSIYNTYANVPTYSWSVNVLSHEFGHLFGSQHTHDCVWNGNNTAIDGCSIVQGGCSDPGLPPAGSGTIMSYCHTTSVGVNFANGFGPQPGNVIRNSVTVATCLNVCPGGPPTCTDGIQNGNETGIDCGGTCPPCAAGCTTNLGLLTLVLDEYPTETSWTITNSSGVVIYSGGGYQNAFSTVTVPVCLPDGCYNFNMYDSFGDGICCLYGNGSYNLVINSVNVASGGVFATQIITPFCLASGTCTDGIQNGTETGIDCGGSCPACVTCSDGIQNGTETGVDCGGSCPACPTCNDGIQNGTETGIDCGGSCGFPVVSITGSASICVGSTTTLSPSTGGTWSSSNPAIATVTNAGAVTGVAAGTATFIFTNTAGCASLPTAQITVNAKPVVSINGSASICVGSTTTISPSTGGTWSSSNPAIATVTNAGVVTGVAAGNATFIFTNTAGCASLPTAQITVNARPVVSITGSASICVGSTTTLSPGTGGTWSSSNPTIATVTNLGVVTGVTGGTAAFIFTNTAGCASLPTAQITVNARPVVSITGSASICVGSTTTLSPGTGGTWSSSNPAIATVTNAGVVTGVSPGFTTFTFTNTTTGCQSLPTAPITINPSPNVSVTGSNSICEGATTTLSPITGGTWTSSDPLKATVNNAGLVTAVSSGMFPSGNVTFTFTSSVGCISQPTPVVVINAIPNAALNGQDSTCIGSTIQLITSMAGQNGTWTSSNPSVATVSNNSSNFGTVTGLSLGTSAFTITTTAGCVSTLSPQLTIIPEPIVSILGNDSICVGTTTALSPSTPGTWTTSNSTRATVSTTGIVTGVSPGFAYFGYTSNLGCAATNNVLIRIVNKPIASIEGSDSICVSGTTTLQPSSGGTWTSSDESVATVTNEGVVTGVALGSASFIFTNDIGCASLPTSPIVVTSTIPVFVSIEDTAICEGSATYLYPQFGGTWTSDNENIAYVEFEYAAIGVFPGSTTFTFTGTNGCITQLTNALTVKPVPSVTLNGSDTLCVGSSTTVSPSTGGNWESSNYGVGYIQGIYPGILTGISEGFVELTFTADNGCVSYLQATVVECPTCYDGIQNGDETGIDCGGSCPFPVITGVQFTNLCIGQQIQLYHALPGATTLPGVYTSSNSSVASIDPTSGVVNALSVGTVTFTFTSTGECSVTSEQFTVNPLPVVSFPSVNNICVGTTLNLTPTSGGEWFTNDSLIAIPTNTGVLSCLGVGSTLITFRDSIYFCKVDTEVSVINCTGTCTDGIQNGDETGIDCGGSCQACPTCSDGIQNGNETGIDCGGSCGYPTVSIVGNDSICVGSTTTLSPSSGGTWASSNPAVATVTNAGVVTGLASGSATFTFTNSVGCSSLPTNPITVNDTPAVSISGSNSICINSTTTLSPTTGGTWTSNNPSIATVTNAGVVTGVSVGIATFTFTSYAGCTSSPTNPITVNTTTPVTIGSTSICVGSTTIYGPTTGGTWTSSNTSVATITNAGVITGISAGTAFFTFLNTAGCLQSPTAPITVNNKPIVSITGSNSICIGSTTVLSPTTGGTWTSNNPSIATVTNAGVVTGVAAGSATFTFTSTATGCISNATGSVTINAVPAVTITGANSICIGSTTTLSPTTGGTWTSSNASVATVTNAGVVTGVADGTATFIFTNTAGCASLPTAPITINAYSNITLGSSSICVGSTTTYGPNSGTWVSSNSSVATITNAGVVTGISEGSAYFTFTNAAGCTPTPTAPITVNAIPVVSISGSNSICIGSTTTLSPTTGGTWTSNNPSVATVTNAGVVTGVAAGTATFIFTNTAGCASLPTPPITINAYTSVTLGSSSICVGSTTTYGPNSGTWVSSNSSVATITNAGVVTGISEGSAYFTFTNAAGCTPTPTAPITVNAIPVVSISGSNSICIGSTTVLSPTTGGTWTSNNPSIATVTNAGVVTGLAAGSATFIFTSTATGCASNATGSITINAKPAVTITGANSLCIGSTTTLSPATGGTWTSSNASVATVTNAGVVTGVASGSATFTFTSTATGCVSNATGSVTINAKPAVTITGANSLCIGSTTTLSPTTGGTWTSSNASVATVTNAGVVTGVAAGSATFTFTSTATGCVSNATGSVTINAKPAVTITGANSICIGSTTTLSPTTGGTWTSSNASVATVTNGGVVTGLAAGSATFIFTSTATGCTSDPSSAISIAAKPVVSITGGTSICVASTSTLSPSTGGTWASNNSAIATVTNAGVVTGVTAGNATFTFTNSTGCASNPTPTITIKAKPVVSITGSASICVAATTTLSPTTGGTWTSSNTAIATITNGGVVTGVAAGSATFTFTNTTTTCSETSGSITVSAKPVVSITGGTSICVGSTSTLSPSTGGTWTSSNTAIATVTNGGVVTGVAAGSTTFTFTNSTGCISLPTSAITIKAKPVVSIIGYSTVCVGSTTKLSPTTGGTWASSNTAIATVTNAGIVTGVTAGAVTFTFTNTTSGCSSTTSTITVESCTNLIGHYFETGWDNWVDGGVDAARYTGVNSAEGLWSIQLRDNSGVASAMTSQTLTTAGSYSSLKVNFKFKMVGVETGEDFWLQYSSNGTTWTTVKTWVRGTTYLNNEFYYGTATLNSPTYTLTNTAKFRFVSDASDDSDVVYIDAVVINGYSSAQASNNQLVSRGIENEEEVKVIEENITYNIYPNPVNSILNINMTNFDLDKDISIKIYSVTGTLIETIKPDQSLIYYDVSGLNTGLYLMLITENDVVKHTEKVNVSH
jgi:uncharacterized protein YjdB